MKVRYVGKSFGVDGLTDGKIYEVLGLDEFSGALRVVDDSGEDYLYDPRNPKPFFVEGKYGRFEIVEDDENGTLTQAVLGVE